jgi:hypothetical protein
MRSLRTRLFVYVAGGAALLIALAGVALTWTIATWLQEEFDEGLEAKARALVALTEEEAGFIKFDLSARAVRAARAPAARAARPSGPPPPIRFRKGDSRLSDCR